jgi:predicted RNase H-like nuclease (RuvC/YqgF family)
MTHHRLIAALVHDIRCKAEEITLMQRRIDELTDRLGVVEEGRANQEIEMGRKIDRERRENQRLEREARDRQYEAERLTRRLKDIGPMDIFGERDQILRKLRNL